MASRRGATACASRRLEGDLTMDLFLQLLGQYGLPIVFVAVLLEQGGLPLPAYPVVIAASSLTVAAGEPAWPIVLVTALAALIADLVWFAGGRRFGARMLRLMCSLSLSRDSCVGSARATYLRWGLPSLVIAKFVPGLAAVATTLAGQMRIPPRRFLLYDGAGALLWASVAVMLGVVFHDIVNDVLAHLDAWGGYGLLLLAGLVASFVCYKAWQRRRFRQLHRMRRITVAELKALLESDQAPTIVDVRASAERAGGWIPGAVLPAAVTHGPAVAEEVVVYCDCPGEASAAVLARELAAQGRGNARPLAGGFQAWKDAGLPVQEAATPGASPPPQPGSQPGSQPAHHGDQLMQGGAGHG
jgi:membrane protein DedA with SNARE-associated domain/rhodanese-related sulfurtransferase